MNKQIFNFNQTAEAAAAALGANETNSIVFSSFTLEAAEAQLESRLNRGWIASACSVTKFDADGEALTLPSVLVMAKAF